MLDTDTELYMQDKVDIFFFSPDRPQSTMHYRSYLLQGILAAILSHLRDTMLAHNSL